MPTIDNSRPYSVLPPSKLSAFKPLWMMFAVLVTLSAVLRSYLWLRFGIAANVPAIRLPSILLLGAINDAIEFLYLLLPFALYLALTSMRWNRRRAGRVLLYGGVWLMIFGMLFVCAMEYFFFEEFDSRFNLVAVDYLIYPTEVIGDIRAEYPVGSLSLILGVVAAFITWALRRRLAAWPGTEPVSKSARAGLVGGLALLIVAAIVAWPADRLSLYRNRVANELAANGPANFFAAFRTNHIDYDAFYRTGDPQKMQDLLVRDLQRGGGEFVNLPAGDLTRRFPARPEGLGKLNIVLLSEESLGAEFVGTYGDKRNLTPEFDALAKQGLLFTHAYATGTRTVRGLEAFSASFPPIPSESIMKRQGFDDIATWGKTMRGLGYHTSFLYGGFGAFDNMNAYFAGNGFALSDRSDIQHPKFANIWGVSDEDLFHHAIDYFDARAKDGKPFFSIVMSTSNHKPFTFPDGIPGIKPKGGGRNAGTQYADYAIGEFFREARKHPWFDNTLFIVAADHGARAYGKADIPLYSYEIPMLILAPAHLQPRLVDTLTSQIDVAPTVLGILGLPYQAPFFGQDVLRWPAGEPRTLLFNHNHDVALMRDGKLCILGLHQSAECQGYVRTPGAPGPATTHFSHLDQADPELVDLATAYYQTAYDQFQSHRYR
ncbi:MAG: sulfatase [Hydrocarboniphaga sp.]|uniref:LTA synthase family protein n=1 Tax=Hydrocarboniphaga sp. TaxID=2033016 RepID=UPI0026083AAA|nr:LTA synthase family protein [Hydrocarboniphaga sp.]MDB5969038.1 sulfatase [Hydrocarboniphaga sp.]